MMVAGGGDVESGNLVKVRVYGGEVVTRRVVAVSDERVLICREDEYEAAQREGREPVSVGFRKGDIVSVESQETTDA